MNSMVKSPEAKTLLSIIILNYNSGSYLQKCLDSISKSDLNSQLFEIIVVDNNSQDDSIFQAQKIKLPNTKYLLQKTNYGFAAGNNQGLKLISPSSSYVLFLNPDTTLNNQTLSKMLNFFKSNPTVDAATCKIILVKTNQLQPECHRGFPTPWRSFCHFSGLSQIFPKSKIFNGYFQGHLDLSQPHPIEACVGAFIMIKKAIGQSIGWWSEDYFFYGEDLDLCYQLYQKKYQLWFFPDTSINHYQGISSGIKKHTQTISSANRQTRVMAAKASTQAMRIFYQRNFRYPKPTKFLVAFGINFLELVRVFKAKFL